MADIYIHYGTDGAQMAYELMREAEIAKRLKPSMKVVLKPNLVVSRPADGGATTHPEIAEGIVRYLQESGVRDITIAEGSWVGVNTESAFQRCGYRELEKKYGVKLLDTKRDTAVAYESHGFSLKICETPLKADYLINIPVLKGHCQTDMTCCLKNMKGCIPDSEKRRFHTTGLHKPIAALATALKPDLHIVDSICGDLTFEEGGNPVESNRVMLGFDPVLLDSYGAGLMGYLPEQIDHLRLARDYGAGKFCDDTTSITELNSGCRPKTPQPRSRIAKQLARFVQEDSACSACYAALIFALNQSGTGGLADGALKIGQGFRGRELDGWGVGDCARGCAACIPGCPPKAVDIVRFLETAAG